jgi:hypothetical protein
LRADALPDEQVTAVEPNRARFLFGTQDLDLVGAIARRSNQV